MRDRSLTVEENAQHLTVGQCYAHLERVDDEIGKHGELHRLIECRRFFEYHLKRCLRKREGRHYDYDRRSGPDRSASAANRR
jgi:hypothetical protein